MTVEEALAIFDLEQPVTPERVEERYQTLRRTWHPPRYAHLTNNPKQYMKMYKKAEEMLKEVEEAYGVLTTWLTDGDATCQPWCERRISPNDD